MEKRLDKEQEVPMFEYNSVVQELVKISKAEKDNLDHQIVLATASLNSLREEHIKRQGEFNQWRMAEEQKFKNEVSRRHNQLVDQENKMQILVKDLQQRQADLLVKEERYIKVEEEKRKIDNARVEIEKIRVAAVALMAEADRKISQADSAVAQSNVHIEKATKLDEKNNLRNQELCVREDKLQADLKSLEMERNHLTELKEYVDPRILEIKQLEEQILLDKKEISEKHQDIINKTEENKVALKALEDKKMKLDAQERELRSREDELKRKILISGAKA